MRSRNNSKAGSALLIVLILGTIVGLGVWYTMNYAVTGLRQTVASRAWSHAIHTAEAGVAIAGDEFNKSTETGYTAWSGWTTSGSNELTLAYTALAPAGHDALDSEYTVTVNTNTFEVTSTGRLALPGTMPPVTRTVRMILKPAYKSPFTQGILVQDTITLSGDLDMDAFDSSDTNKSTNGQFDPTKATTNCSIVALSSSGISITGNGGGTLNGDATTAGGTVSVSGGFSIDGTVTNTAAQEIDPITVPTSTIMTDPAINNSTTIVVAGTRDMAIPSISLVAHQELLVTGTGLLRLYVDFTISFGGQSTLRITPNPAGAPLAVHIYANGDINLGGGGAINETLDAASLMIFGTPNCLDVKYSGNSEFKGVLNTPSADVTLTGANGTTGAVIGKSVNVSGNSHFYFDEALGKLKNDTIISYSQLLWNEL